MAVTTRQLGEIKTDVDARGNTNISAEDSLSRQFKASLEAQGIVTSDNHVPFWMRANQFGSVPLDGPSTAWIGRISRDYTSNPEKKFFDWGTAVEGRFNLGNRTDLLLIEAYAKARLGIFELRAGRSKDMMGLADSTLSTGAFAVSGNALGIPKLQIAIPEFYRIPIWEGLLAFKGNFVYGWFGTTPINHSDPFNYIESVKEVKSYFHQKSLYGRLGKPEWRLNVIAGFNHQVMYGNERKFLRDFNLDKFESFYHAVTGKTWVGSQNFKTKLGNQLGSIDLGITYDWNNAHLFVYRQQFYDVGALARLANVRDGLTGISLKNKIASRSGWEKIVLELFYSKNQAGELWSPVTKSGDEQYYNNFMYASGWSYKGVGIGNPFVTPRHEGRSNLRYRQDEYFVNNRVIAFHGGMEGHINKYNIKTKLSYSMNYGTYGSSPIGTSLGKDRFVIDPPYFEKVNQFSGYLEVSRSFAKDWQCGIAGAFDSGQLLYNSFGLLINVKKSLRF
ncbi:capsule assembly Wzi family protein [Dyadobacter fermentans]|uniref:Capsule assembly protein Wzi n=1 Tax=Dyadobacter fermentans (strain ATCC 700827 / DSM 18053 / CIP 107007 / KCTC 52180 / NS114) TaxID=471854 RepID=C6VUL4_DYAFD|nr:capsule assembly Wzi family protein [Dyadobacter fermentans]ACT91323.1 hypothetical protein Dfer_0051 [Dyadobacter fermentans DSM 18053]